MEKSMERKGKKREGREEKRREVKTRERKKGSGRLRVSITVSHPS